jgi:hypothetical protein
MSFSIDDVSILFMVGLLSVTCRFCIFLVDILTIVLKSYFRNLTEFGQREFLLDCLETVGLTFLKKNEEVFSALSDLVLSKLAVFY